jgi:hypothetical protein
MDIDEIPRESTDAPIIQERRSGTFGTGIKYFKYMYSFSLLIFSVVIVMAAIFQQKTTATANMGVPPVAASMIFWFLICCLGVMEGGQGALVGLQMIDKAVRAFIIHGSKIERENSLLRLGPFHVALLRIAPNCIEEHKSRT